MFDIASPLEDHFVFSMLLKALPLKDGEDRILYVEASKENRDYDGEVVLAKALRESADHFTKFGVVDLDHKSIPSVAAKLGVHNPDEWIIGQPLAVRFDGDRTLVKAVLRSGDTPLARQADIVWDGLTRVHPPVRYYASVGGRVLDRDIRTDPKTGETVPVITKTLWNNLALSLSPVNQHLGAATTVPMMVFSKSMGGFVAKALTAGYGTDAATLTGGAALGRQSLSPEVVSYFDFRERLAGDIRRHKTKPISISGLAEYVSREYRLQHEQAVQWVGQFLSDLKRRKNHE